MACGRAAAGYGEGVGFWRAKKAFRDRAYSEVALAFEREYASRFERWGDVPEVEPTRRGLFRESGEGAWLDLKVQGIYLDATFELAERKRGRWIELTTPSEFGRLLREQADEFLAFLEERATSEATAEQK
jgi:hypothetical protein